MKKVFALIALALMTQQAQAEGFSDSEFRSLVTNSINVVNADIQEYAALNCDEKTYVCDEKGISQVKDKLNWRPDAGNGQSFVIAAKMEKELKSVLVRVALKLDVLDKDIKAGKIKTYADSNLNMRAEFQNKHMQPESSMIAQVNEGYFSPRVISAVHDLNKNAMSMKGYDKRFIVNTDWAFK